MIVELGFARSRKGKFSCVPLSKLIIYLESFSGADSFTFVLDETEDDQRAGMV